MSTTSSPTTHNNYILNPDVFPAYEVIAYDFVKNPETSVIETANLVRVSARKWKDAEAITRHPSIANKQNIVIRNNNVIPAKYFAIKNNTNNNHEESTNND